MRTLYRKWTIHNFWIVLYEGSEGVEDTVVKNKTTQWTGESLSAALVGDELQRHSEKPNQCKGSSLVRGIQIDKS